MAKLRPLIIDEAFKAEVAKVVQYAQEHPYIVGEAAIPPGDDPGHVLNTVFGYRIVFSFTRMPDALYRDLSISVPEKGKYPNPFATFEIATLFGFTGWDGKSIRLPEGWMIDKDLYYEAIRLGQRIQE